MNYEYSKKIDDSIIHYLKEFSESADEWFSSWDGELVRRYKFFKEFFIKENLEKAEWKDFQKIGDNLHAFLSMPLAKSRALGNPNYSIEHYRKSFLYLIHGRDPLEKRITQFKSNSSEYGIKFFGGSVISELVAYAFPEKFIFWNKRHEHVPYFFGIELNMTRGESYGERFIRFNSKMKGVFKLYEKIVGSRSELSIPLQVDQFLSWLYENYDIDEEDATDDIEEIDTSNLEEGETIYSPINFYKFSPGPNAIKWDEFYEKNIIALNHNDYDIGDLSQYEDENAIKKAMGISIDKKSNDSWNFFLLKTAKLGDIVIANKGVRTVLGFGIIDEEYFYNKDADYKHQRSVKWIANKTLSYPEDELQKIGYSTLFRPDTFSPTKPYQFIIDKYLKHFPEYKNIFSEHGMNASENIHQLDDDIENYWWLNANPKQWSIDEFKIGELQTYTTHNEKGNKRRIYKYFQKAKAGDWVVGYESTPSKKIKALFQIKKGIHENAEEGEVISFVKKVELAKPITWSELKDIKGLENCEVLNNNQGSLFRLTSDEFEIIRDIIDERNTEVEIEQQSLKGKPYHIEDALEDLFLSKERLETIVKVLSVKKNIILKGPPGVGKTFMAKRLAKILIGHDIKKDSRIETVQFHQSYSYEDFIQGIRPAIEGDKQFKIQNGLFYNLCEKAKWNLDNKYFIIIDEINRGNLSKIFGELMMLIEHDKRGDDWGLKLTYSQEEEFYVPENIYIIGTMNTADRSLALVDYALRRRFAFIDIEPHFGKKFKAFLSKKNIPSELVQTISERIKKLNKIISKNFDKGFEIGHSYFCPTEFDNLQKSTIEDWYNNVIEMEIRPLLEEYWFDKNELAQGEIKKLEL